MSYSALLRAINLCKSYAGVRALRNASFELRAGEVHALVGENGAGKSTLIKIITGAEQADSGEIWLNGEVITHNSPRHSKSLGIAAIYQQPALFPDLTVAENVSMGLERPGALRRIDWTSRHRRADELLKQVGARINTNALAGDLTLPQQQLVEIARAVGSDARVLIMDEPTASLSDQDTRNLYRVIAELRARDVGIIYISHRLDELPVVADRVSVLRDGCMIDTRLMRDTGRQELISLMVGRELSAIFPKTRVETGNVVLELRHFGCRSAGVRDVNFTLQAGEIVGLAGLVGAGRTELAESLFGLTPADEGEVLINGELARIDSPAKAIKHGLAYLPEDRRRHGVILDMPISANITLASLNRLSRFGFMDFDREKEIAVEYSRQFAIKTPAVFAAVSTLSGGNQQKVGLSRWLATKPRVLVLDEPTQGIDVGAKSEIHALMCELASRGMAILMISSELPEILGMSDRVVVMRGGTIAGTMERSEATQEGILAMALGDSIQESAGHAEPAST